MVYQWNSTVINARSLEWQHYINISGHHVPRT